MAEWQRVDGHADRQGRHGAREREQSSEKGLERAGCDRDARRVVNELEEQILSNVVHCRAARESGFVPAIMESEPPAAAHDPEDESESHSTVGSIQSE